MDAVESPVAGAWKYIYDVWDHFLQLPTEQIFVCFLMSVFASSSLASVFHKNRNGFCRPIIFKKVENTESRKVTGRSPEGPGRFPGS